MLPRDGIDQKTGQNFDWSFFKQNDTKLEAKLHFFWISSFIGDNFMMRHEVPPDFPRVYKKFYWGDAGTRQWGWCSLHLLKAMIRYLSLVPILIKLLNILTREDDHWTIQRRRVRWRGWDGLSEDGVAFPLRHDYHLKRTYSRSSFS